jgi:polar amino acid transport system permease protein
LRQTQIVAGKTFRPFELYTAAMIAYFLLCYPVARGVDRIYRRVAHLGSS